MAQEEELEKEEVEKEEVDREGGGAGGDFEALARDIYSLSSRFISGPLRVCHSFMLL